MERGKRAYNPFIDYDEVFGNVNEMTPEQREALRKLWEYLNPKVLPQSLNKDGKPIGRIMVFGTMGEDSRGSEDFEKMFYNPEGYNIISFTPTY